MLTCLDCCGPLEKFDGGQHRCPNCGIWYADELLATADPAVWAKIQTGRLFCYACDQALPGVPRVHVGKRRRWWAPWRKAEGQPVACPKHGPAPGVQSPASGTP